MPRRNQVAQLWPRHAPLNPGWFILARIVALHDTADAHTFGVFRNYTKTVLQTKAAVGRSPLELVQEASLCTERLQIVLCFRFPDVHRRSIIILCDVLRQHNTIILVRNSASEVLRRSLEPPNLDNNSRGIPPTAELVCCGPR